MTNEMKQEALEQLELDIKFGFENEQELFDGIRDMFYNEPGFDEVWLKETIAEKYALHLAEATSWTHPTGFEKLAKAFDELIKEGIVCIHKAGYTKSDGEEDGFEAIDRLKQLGIKAIGFCYYHAQDLARAVDPEVQNLYFGFDSAKQDDDEAIVVANKIIDKLKQQGFEMAWPGTVDQRIEIKYIDWKKIPDNREWGIERVIQILSKSRNDKKPFWKFW